MHLCKAACTDRRWKMLLLSHYIFTSIQQWSNGSWVNTGTSKNVCVNLTLEMRGQVTRMHDLWWGIFWCPKLSLGLMIAHFNFSERILSNVLFCPPVGSVSYLDCWFLSGIHYTVKLSHFLQCHEWDMVRCIRSTREISCAFTGIRRAWNMWACLFEKFRLM